MRRSWRRIESTGKRVSSNHKKIQKDIEIKKATLTTVIEQLVEKKVTVEEQINRKRTR